jgi:hypothetical protein
MYKTPRNTSIFHVTQGHTRHRQERLYQL